MIKLIKVSLALDFYAGRAEQKPSNYPEPVGAYLIAFVSEFSSLRRACWQEALNVVNTSILAHGGNPDSCSAPRPSRPDFTLRRSLT